MNSCKTKKRSEAAERTSENSVPHYLNSHQWTYSPQLRSALLRFSAPRYSVSPLRVTLFPRSAFLRFPAPRYSISPLSCLVLRQWIGSLKGCIWIQIIFSTGLLDNLISNGFRVATAYRKRQRWNLTDELLKDARRTGSMCRHWG